MIEIARSLPGHCRRSRRRRHRGHGVCGRHRIGRSRASSATLRPLSRHQPPQNVSGRPRARCPPTGSSPPRRRRIPFAPPAPRHRRPEPPGSAAAPPAAPMPPTVTPAVSGTLREYLQSKGVKLEAQKPQGLQRARHHAAGAHSLDSGARPERARCVSRSSPTGKATASTASNAQVVVYKLVGNFDPSDAITHGYVDSQKLLAWQTTNASMADFGGFPSSVIEGTYRDGDMTLNTSRRHVIATSGRDKYLVSLSVTTDRAVAIADAPATDAIINGFRVAAAGRSRPRAGPARPLQAPVAPRHGPRCAARAGTGQGAGRAGTRCRAGRAPRAGRAARSADRATHTQPLGDGARAATAAQLLVSAALTGDTQRKQPEPGERIRCPTSYCEAHADCGRAVHVCRAGLRRVRDVVAFTQSGCRHHRSWRCAPWRRHSSRRR